ncbi:hypothetical protein vseg_015830 [Gypsophila vaccaria]
MEQHNNVPSEIQEEATSSTTTSNTSSPYYGVTEINARHYKLILEDADYAFREEAPDPSELLRTSDKSTILHIVASMAQGERMIHCIVDLSPSLLTRPDSKDDLPIHVAVRAGHVTVVQKLIDLGDRWEIRLLEHVNNEKNTALHIALENQQKDMASMLYVKCPNIINCKNKQGISPMYLAIKAGFWGLVTKMIDYDGDAQVSRVFKDNNNNELLKHSTIHAVIMARNKDILEKIIRKYPDEVLHSVDEKGRKPLSYAAYIGFLGGVKCIINMKDGSNYLYRNQAFKADVDGSFPIHSACRGGDIRVVREMFTRLPEKMSWLLNRKGQNILHVAAQSGQHAIVEHILTRPKLGTMVNMKDEDGYTPLHLGVLGKNPRVVYALTWDIRTKLNLQCKKGFTALDIAEHCCGDVPSFEERLIWLALVYAGVRRAPQVQQSNELEMAHIQNEVELHGKTTFIVTQEVLQPTNHPKNKHKLKYKERINTLLIISTLVATVTYASGFTVPGGYNNSNPKVGLATLDNKFAFQVFVISSTLAMHSSILAMVALIWAHLDDVRLALVSLDVALPLLGTALVTMSVAFMTGLYVVMDDMVWLKVVVLVMGGVFLGVFVLFFVPLYSPKCVKYKFMRYFFHVPFSLMLLACDKSKCDTTLY